MHPGGRLPYHSDEIVRDLHPLPFYPFQSAGRLRRPANNERHLLFYIQFSIHCSTLHPKAQGAVCMFCRIFSAFLGVLTAAGAKSHTSVSHPAAWRHARSYRRFWPAAHPWGKGVGRHGNNGTCAASALGKERMAAGRVFVFCRFTTLNRLQLAWQCGKLIWI